MPAYDGVDEYRDRRPPDLGLLILAWAWVLGWIAVAIWLLVTLVA